MRPSKFHLVKFDQKCDGAAEGGRVLGTPNTGNAASDHKQESFTDRRKVAQNAGGDLHD
jgi:hypothetical protein